MSDAARLVTWFRASARPLPWREEPRDAYRTLVSELMAQQTQLDRVVPRFEVFIERFPTLASLAAASEDEVVGAWSGLGYYRRARLLHRLAREVAAGSGELPRTAADLEKLPGVGPYTAAAIASMVHGEAVPLMDGNIARVGARILAEGGDPRKGMAKKAILGWVRGLMDDADPSEVNEGLMELGAMICLPSNPSCGACPLAAGCRGSTGGDPTAYPPPRKVRETIRLRWLAVIVEDVGGRWLLRKITTGPILRGLWLPPVVDVDDRRTFREQALGLLPFSSGAKVELLESIRHSITHRRIEITPVRLVLDHPQPSPRDWKWVDPNSPGVPTSSLVEKLMQRVKR